MREAPGEAHSGVLTCPGRGSDCCNSPCWQAKLDSHPTTTRGYSPSNFHHKQLWLSAAKVIKDFLCDHLRRQVWCQTKLQSGWVFLPSETKSRGKMQSWGNKWKLLSVQIMSFPRKWKRQIRKTPTEEWLVLLCSPDAGSAQLCVPLQDTSFSNSELFHCLSSQRLQNDAVCNDPTGNCPQSFDSWCFLGAEADIQTGTLPALSCWTNQHFPLSASLCFEQ